MELIPTTDGYYLLVDGGKAGMTQENPSKKAFKEVFEELV